MIARLFLFYKVTIAEGNYRVAIIAEGKYHTVNIATG